MRFLSAAILICAVALVTAEAPVSGQEPAAEPMRLVFQVDDVDYSLYTVDVLVDGRVCASTLMFPGATVDLPRAGGAEPCGREGATIELVTFAGYPLAETWILRRGAEVTITDVSARLPIPILNGERVAEGGPMRIDLWSTNLVAFVDGVACARTTAERTVTLGAPGQPGVCGREGGVVTFLKVPPGSAYPHVATLFLNPGAREVVVNEAPWPPHTDIPAYMQAFLDRGGGLAPADSGQAGLVDTAPSPPFAPAVALLVLLLVLGGRWLTAAQSTSRRQRSMSSAYWSR